jgi:hypothetical protein
MPGMMAYWCNQCEQLFAGLGACPGGSYHDNAGSFQYKVDQSGGQFLQPGWDVCSKCTAIYYFNASNNICPEWGTHSRLGETLYMGYLNG